MDDLIGQLVFLVIAAAIWIVGEAARKRREKAEREQQGRQEDRAPPPVARESKPRAPGSPPEAPAEPKRKRERARVVLEDILGIPRTEPKPEPPPPRPRPQPVAKPAPRPVAKPRPTPQPVEGRAPTLAATSSSQLQGKALARLGIDPGTSARAATRRAILWAEVLGPPRAMRGPQRPPMMRPRR